MCCCAIGCQHSTLNRLFGSWFGCVFLVWRHHLRIIGAQFHAFFSTIFLFLTFLNIHIYFIILKTHDQQFTLTTKKSLHIIFKALRNCIYCIGCLMPVDFVRRCTYLYLVTNRFQEYRFQETTTAFHVFDRNIHNTHLYDENEILL